MDMCTLPQKKCRMAVLRLIHHSCNRPEVNNMSIDIESSSQAIFAAHVHFRMLTSFIGLDGIFVHSPGARKDIYPCVILCFFPRLTSFNCFAMFFATPVGQASNPGPDDCIRLAVCNPTAINKKVGNLLKFQADIVSVSETSATSVVQKEVAREMLGQGFSSFWSPPVAPKKHTVDNRPSYRGEAVGAALFSKLPTRRTRCDIPLALQESQRFCSAVVRFGTCEVLVISIYGFANRYKEGKRPNDLLLASVIPVVNEVGLPYIICGDFNEPLSKLPSFQFFRDDGAIEAFDWYFRKFGHQLPPTCGGSTRNDTAIFHPWVADWLYSMETAHGHVMDMHTPLFIHFSCSKFRIARNTWNFPRSWAPFAPPTDVIHHVYEPIRFNDLFDKPDDLQCEDLQQALQLWSKNVETAVDKAMAYMHGKDASLYPKNGLHSSYKGRCNFAKITASTSKPRVKSDRHGGYVPPSEVFSLQSRLKIRQVRRLKSLLRRYKSLPLDGDGCPSSNADLRDALLEWKRILSAKGYGNSWKNWTLSFEMIPFLTMWLPSFECLELLVQITEHDCDHTCRMEASQRAMSFKHRIMVDAQHDYSRLSYKIIRSKETKALAEVPVEKKFSATLLRSKIGETALKIDADYVIPAFAKLKLDDAVLVFCKQEGKKIWFRHESGYLPSHGTLTVNFVAVTPDELANEFRDFWTPMWCREDKAEQFSGETWSDFHNMLDGVQFPRIDPIVIPFHDVDVWMSIIRKLPGGKAVGPCGWSNDELKVLPKKCIADLAWIFSRIAVKGFGRAFMMAKTVLLAKIDVPLSMHHVRPITILSCLYRLFGKFVFKHVAAKWKDILPFSISGGLPCRGVKELAFSQKRVIEDAISTGSSMGGFSLDLIKAYNTFGRFATAKIMYRLGLPWSFLMAWLHSLDHLVRYPFINGHFAVGIQSTTGVPEGCSISVLAMIATSSMYYFKMVNQYISPYAYADNWSWMSTQQRAHFVAYETVLRLTEVLRLTIDFKKSWHWGTTKTFREACLQVADLHQDVATPVTIKSCVKDLGEIVHYDKSASLGFIKEKIDESIARLQKIEWLPTTLQKKAQYIQSAVWPLALYSADTVYIGQRHFEKLRRAALNALVGHWHSASSILACNCLSKHLQDPFFFVLCQCVRIIRRLANVVPSVAKQTISMAVSYDGSRPFGPATAFKHYLTQVGIELQEDGKVVGQDHLSCNVLWDSTRKIILTLKQMWTYHVISSMNRKGVGDYLVDFPLANRVFMNFDDDMQQLVKLNVVGGYQTQSTKAKWDKDIDDKCIFCNMPDTREHRLLECSVGTDIRQEFHQVCMMLKDERPEWIYLPLPRQHQMCLLLRAYIQLVKPPIIPQVVENDNAELRFFTDGGAINPTCAAGRIATWSVVQDVSNTDKQRHDASGFLLGPEPKFPCFKVAALGVVHGDQTVSRGELLAILTAAQIATNSTPKKSTEFVTDASYVCKIIELIRSGLWKFIAHKIPNSDLIAALAKVWDFEFFRVTKVKSHRNFSDAKDAQDLWYIAGNFCADMAATAAFRCVPPDIRKLADEIAHHTKHEECRLKSFFTFLASITRLRCEALHKHEMEHGKPAMQIPKTLLTQPHGLFNPTLMGEDAHAFMCNFNPPNYKPLDAIVIEDDVFSACLQGANIGKATMLWLSKLTWPENVADDDPSDWGISWFEMVVSFYHYTGFRFPIRASGAGNKSVYVSFDSDDAMLMPMRQKSAVLQSICLKNMVQNLSTLVQDRFFPAFGLFKCRTLTRLGMKGVLAGISRRPGLPNPKITMDYVKSYLDNMKGLALEAPIYTKDLKPEMTFPMLPEPTTQQRYNTYASRMKLIRRSRLNVEED